MLNTAPFEWTISHLIEHIETGPTTISPSGRFVPARPYGFYSLGNRFRLAWMVFTGKADALLWPGQMPKAH
jgi:hypothetical protein